jgi:hypothetical protein
MKQRDKLLVTIRILLYLQVVLYLIGLLIIWITRNSNDFSGLVAIYPLAGFNILLLVNLILLIKLFIVSRSNKIKIRMEIKLLISAILLFIIFGTSIASLVSGYGFSPISPSLPMHWLI